MARLCCSTVALLLTALLGGGARAQPLGASNISSLAGNGVAGFSGDGGTGTSARLSSPYGVAMDGGGNLLIADRE
jgi:hypothetical protein